MEYNVVFKIDARCSISVEANSIEEAKHKAANEFMFADLGNDVEYVNAYPMYVNDSEDNIVWEV